jgi:hypothetical protein
MEPGRPLDDDEIELLRKMESGKYEFEHGVAGLSADIAWLSMHDFIKVFTPYDGWTLLDGLDGCAFRLTDRGREAINKTES